MLRMGAGLVEVTGSSAGSWEGWELCTWSSVQCAQPMWVVQIEKWGFEEGGDRLPLETPGPH